MAAKSLTTRTSLWFTLMAAGVLAVMGLVIQISVQRHFHDLDRDALQGKLELVRHVLRNAPPSREAEIRADLADAFVGHHDLLVRIRQPSGGEFLSAGHAVIPDSLLAVTSVDGSPAVQEWSANDTHYRALTARIPATDPGAFWTVAIATDTRHHTDFLSAFNRELLLIGFGGLVLIAGLGRLVTRRGLRPVEDMAQVAARISAQRLDERLPLDRIPVELQPLALAFNNMLDRLGDSLQRLSAFSSDLAHELRTPINNLMTQTQVSLSRPREADEYREILYSNLEEFERLGRMIADMLFLAKADNGLMVPTLQPVNLRAEAEALVEFYDALAADAGLRLQVEGEGRVAGDALMLRRAVSNLLSNAIRHADAGSTVRIGLETDNGQVRLHIRNTGDDIAPEHLPRLFDRFYRVDDSRQRQDEGAGLGLAITRSIIRAHQGDIGVTSGNRITTFTVTLPADTRMENPA
ncbi:MAG TPA: heavy metal sensor histidine kinase [Fluviicoccus sp.]|nr:heavy metal sensor histidine kinase [Fluviicoccus sp.]